MSRLHGEGHPGPWLWTVKPKSGSESLEKRAGPEGWSSQGGLRVRTRAQVDGWEGVCHSSSSHPQITHGSASAPAPTLSYKFCVETCQISALMRSRFSVVQQYFWGLPPPVCGFYFSVCNWKIPRETGDKHQCRYKNGLLVQPVGSGEPRKAEPIREVRVRLVISRVALVGHWSLFRTIRMWRQPGGDEAAASNMTHKTHLRHLQWQSSVAACNIPGTGAVLCSA